MIIHHFQSTTTTTGWIIFCSVKMHAIENNLSLFQLAFKTIWVCNVCGVIVCARVGELNLIFIKFWPLPADCSIKNTIFFPSFIALCISSSSDPNLSHSRLNNLIPLVKMCYKKQLLCWHISHDSICCLFSFNIDRQDQTWKRDFKIIASSFNWYEVT